MDYLQVNLKAGYALDYKERLEKEYYATDFELVQNYYNEFDTKKFSAIYLAIDLIDIKKIKAIIENVSKNSIIVFWYREMVLLRLVLGKINFSGFDKKIFFTVAKPIESDNLQKIKADLTRMFYSTSDVIPIVVKTKDTEYINDTNWIINYVEEVKVISLYKFNAGDIYYKLKYANAFKNLMKLQDKISSFDIKNMPNNPFKGKPAVMVASGPSLDKNIDVLKKLENKAYIFACDASLSTLKNHNIIPEIAGFLEYRYVAYEKFLKDKTYSPYIKFFGPITIVPEALDSVSENFIIHNSEQDDVDNFFAKVLQIKSGAKNSGGSVAHYLVYLAHYLECEPIILIGQDLAFSEDGADYAKDSDIYNNVTNTRVLNENRVLVKGNYRDLVETTVQWQNFLNDYETLLQNNKIKIINATAGGAYIAGTELMSLEEALADKVDFDKENAMKLVDNLVPQTNIELDDLIDFMIGLIGKYTVLYDNIIEAKKQLKNSDDIIFKGAKTDKQYAKVLSSIIYVSEHVLNYTYDTEPLRTQFTHYIIKSNNRMSALKDEGLTLENLKAQLEIAKDVIKDIEVSVSETLVVLFNLLDDFLKKNKIGKTLADFEELHNYLFLCN